VFVLKLLLFSAAFIVVYMLNRVNLAHSLIMLTK